MKDAVVYEQLAGICIDEYGTPDRKLPDCPQCEEDELWAHPNGTGFSCYRCNWTLTIRVTHRVQA